MSRRAETNHYWRAEGEDVDNNDDNDIIKGTSDNLYFVTITIIIIIIIMTHREITISGVVPKLKSDNTTPSLTRSF